MNRAMLWWTLWQLQSVNYRVRTKAVEKLRASRDPRAIELLIARLAHKDRYVWWNAAEALGQLGNTRAVEPLIVRLTDENSSVLRATMKVLEQLDPQWRQSEGARAAVPALLVRLTDQAGDVRKSAAGALGEFGDARAVRPLIKLAVDRECADMAIYALSSVIKRDPSGVKAEDLQAVARLDSVVGVFIDYSTDNCGYCVSSRIERQVDCHLVRQLARQELIRRGFSA
jgi:HEAT repeat protein